MLRSRHWFVSGAALMIVVFGLQTAYSQDTPGVNDQPDITIPTSLGTTPGVSASFSPVVSDPDVGAGNMEIEIDISDLDGVGGRNAIAGDYGTFSWGGGTGVTTDVAVTTLTAINTLLSTFTYTPPVGFAGTARIVFEIDDQGNTGTGGTLSRTRFLEIDVCAASEAASQVACETNDQPDISLPATLSTSTNTPISFTPVISDVDVGAWNMELEIDISDLDGVGGLSVPAGDYGTFTWGSGSGVTSDIELDTMSDLNTALVNFTYTPPAGFTGTARIIFEIDDQGSSGSEFPANVRARTRFIDISVAAATVQPTATNTPTPTATATGTVSATPIGTPVDTPEPTSPFPTPPNTPDCDLRGLEDADIMRAGVRPEFDLFCRTLVQHGEFIMYFGAALTSYANIGVEALIPLGIQQAVDIFSPSGQTYFNGGYVACLQGSGTLIWLDANNAPRHAEIIGSYTVPEWPGYTCATLFTPGTLVLVERNPMQMAQKR